MKSADPSSPPAPVRARALPAGGAPLELPLRLLFPVMIVPPLLASLAWLLASRGYCDHELGAAISTGLSTFTVSLALYAMVRVGRQNEELGRLEEGLAAMFEAAGAGISQTDPHTGALLRVNDTLCSMLGYAREELLGRSFADITHPDERERDRMGLRRLVTRELDTYAVEKRYIRKDGSTFWGLVTVRLIRDREGRPVRSVVLVQDITERRRASDELQAAKRDAEEAVRRKNEFLATLSHELRMPLSTMLGWIELLREGGLAPEDVTKGLEVLDRNVHTQSCMVEDLLDMSRIGSGKLRLAVEDVDLTAVIDDVTASLRPAAEARSIRLERPHDAAGCVVRGDPTRLRQVLSNLIGNALKFTPRGGWVRVALEEKAGGAEIGVRDNGQGIAPDFLPQVFSRFRQADEASARRQGGLGLGLAIVKHLVELHGGTVQAESEGLGKGAAFLVTLPQPPKADLAEPGGALDRNP